jgi:oxygen-independent coproporphyrinogen III oxidase
MVQRYVNALCREIECGNPDRGERTSERTSAPAPGIFPAGQFSACVDTIYLGGGTPSLLNPKQVEQILQSVRARFEVANNSEVTMEMNPATVTAGSLESYRGLGVNRASFGVQTFNDKHLKLLARGHDANDARQTLKLLRDAGFANISFDLIAGLPGQTVEDWKDNLAEAVAMQPEHLSLYLLEIHEGTPLAEQIKSGRRPVPDEDIAAEMYEIMIDTLADAGYEQYEISNFAKPGFESRHNTKYWRLEPIYGFGVSAHSFDGRQRYSNERGTAKYVSKIERGESAELSRETIDRSSESVFLGLRLTAGIDVGELGTEFTARLPELERYALIQISNGRLKLTRRGMLFSNEVFAEFV